jgi:hypothetical protein
MFLAKAQSPPRSEPENFKADCISGENGCGDPRRWLCSRGWCGCLSSPTRDALSSSQAYRIFFTTDTKCNLRFASMARRHGFSGLVIQAEFDNSKTIYPSPRSTLYFNLFHALIVKYPGIKKTHPYKILMSSQGNETWKMLPKISHRPMATLGKVIKTANTRRRNSIPIPTGIQ